MNLSESYKNRLLELSGVNLLTETDNRSVIVDKVGLPQQVADWAHNLSNKYSIWIANTFRQEAIKYIAGDNEVIKQEILKQFKGNSTQPSLKLKLSQVQRRLEGAYQHIIDWLSRRQQLVPETDVLNLKTLTYPEAAERSDRWHDELKKLTAGQIEDEDGEVIITFPDGFYWIDLKKRYCDKEARALGHCGSGVGNLFSLRKNKVPHLTGDVSNGQLIQLRGRANSKPKPEYHPYIMAFLLSDKVGIKSFNPSSYRAQDNFMLSDFSETDLEHLLDKKPEFTLELDIANKWASDKIISFLEKHPQLVEDFNFLDYVKRFGEEPEIVRFFLHKFPDFVKNIDLKEIIEDLNQKIGIDKASGLIKVLVEDFPQILNNEKLDISILATAAYYSKSPEAKEIFRNAINKKSFQINNPKFDVSAQWIGNTIHFYFNDWTDTAEFFEEDKKESVKTFFEDSFQWDLGSGHESWEYAFRNDYIDEKNLKEIEQLLKSRGHKITKDTDLEELIEENNEDDIQSALNSAMYTGQESGTYDEYYKVITKALHEDIGFEDGSKWATFNVPSDTPDSPTKKLNKLEFTMSESKFYDYLGTALTFLIEEYGSFYIEDVVKKGAEEGDGLASPNFDNTYGDFSEESFNDRLADELPSVPAPEKKIAAKKKEKVVTENLRMMIRKVLNENQGKINNLIREQLQLQNIISSNNPDEIFGFIKSLPEKYKLSTKIGDSFKLYEDGLKTAINNSQIAIFYLAYLRKQKKSSTVLPIPANIESHTYNKIHELIRMIDSSTLESNVGDLNTKLFRAMCFHVLQYLLYEDYFGSIFKQNFHKIVEEIQLPNTTKELQELFLEFNNKDGKIRHTLFFGDTIPVVKTIKSYPKY